MNTAQKLLFKLGAPVYSPAKGRNPSSTKKGPGRYHRQGYKRKSPLGSLAQFSKNGLV